MHPRPLITPLFALITLATFAYFLSVGALLPTLPLYVAGPLSGGELDVGITIGSFGVAALLLRPIAGSMGDRHGRRVPMLFGALLVAGSVAGYGLTDSIGTLVALRLVTGAGEAFFYVAAATVVNDLSPDERRGEALSLFSLALYGGIALGPVVGEWVLHARDFGTVWLVSAASAAIALILAVPVPDTRPAGAADARRHLLHRAALLPGVVILLSVWGQAGFHAFAALHARAIGLPRSQLVFVTFAVVVLAIRLVGARVPDRYGLERTAGTSLVISGAGCIVMGAWAQPAGLYAGTAVFAVGQAFAFPALMSLAVNGVGAHERGAVVGTFTAFVDVAFAAGGTTLGLVAEAAGARAAFVAAGVVTLAGLPIVARIRASREAISLDAEAGEDRADVVLGGPQVADGQA